MERYLLIPESGVSIDWDSLLRSSEIELLYVFPSGKAYIRCDRLAHDALMTTLRGVASERVMRRGA